MKGGSFERRRGSLLVAVLFVMSVLSLAAVSFAYRSALCRRSVRDRCLIRQLRLQAESAARIALARLAEDVNDFDHPAEPWRMHGALAAEDWLAAWGPDDSGWASGGRFEADYVVIDEEGKLNVRYASGEDLRKLGMTPGAIAGLFDWIDGDDATASEGAETPYYLGRSPPYRCKNAPLELLEELVLIRGFSPSDYWEEDADHDGVLDPNENDGGLSAPDDDADGRLRQGWVDLLTCAGDGRINLNSAPPAVLETLPLSDGAVRQIVGFRAFDERSSGQLTDHAFRSAEDIDQLQGLTDADREVLKRAGKFRSEFFRIFVRTRHVMTDLHVELEVLARRAEGGSGPPEILLWTFRP
ncbi:MAG TPA: hypothetical protein VM389_11065 [Phycisphaerae bacterium]|nr:hypothetical protein [Phycisphaerae bacterium]HUU23062.1 hypothetical protein [Phycisphaerae bacterium]